MTSMQNRIYEHYRTHPGRNPKKLSRRKFKKHLKRHGRRPDKTRRTRKVLRNIGTGLTAADKRRMTD